MNSILNLNKEDLRVSKFAPIERDTPIIEILYGEKILMDLSFENDCPEENILIFFHDEIKGVALNKKLLLEIIEQGIQRLQK